MNVFEMFHLELVTGAADDKLVQPRTSYETERYIFRLIRKGRTDVIRQMPLSFCEQPVLLRVGKMSENELR